jgi:hypothetical protein
MMTEDSRKTDPINAISMLREMRIERPNINKSELRTKGRFRNEEAGRRYAGLLLRF